MAAHEDLKKYLNQNEGKSFIVELTHQYLPRTEKLPSFPDREDVSGKVQLGTYSYRTFEELTVRYETGELNRFGGSKPEHYRFDAVLFVQPGRDSLNQKQCFSVGIEIKGFQSDLKQDEKICKYLGWTDFFFIGVPEELIQAAMEKSAMDDRIGVMEITTGKIWKMPVHQKISIENQFAIMQQVFFAVTFKEIKTVVVAEDFVVEPVEFLDRPVAFRNESNTILQDSTEQTTDLGSCPAEENNAPEPMQLSEEELTAREERSEKKRRRQEKVDAVMPTLSPTVQASLKDVDLATQTIYMEMLDRGNSNAESIANEMDMSAAAVRTSMVKLVKVGLAEREGSRKTGAYKLIEQPSFNYTKKCESCDLYKRYSSDCALCQTPECPNHEI